MLSVQTLRNSDCCCRGEKKSVARPMATGALANMKRLSEDTKKNWAVLGRPQESQSSQTN